MSAGAGTSGAAGSQAMTNTVLGGLISKIFTHGIGSGKYAISGPALGSMAR